MLVSRSVNYKDKKADDVGPLFLSQAKQYFVCRQFSTLSHHVCFFQRMCLLLKGFPFSDLVRFCLVGDQKILKARWQTFTEKPASNLDLFRWRWIWWIRFYHGMKITILNKIKLGRICLGHFFPTTERSQNPSLKKKTFFPPQQKNFKSQTPQQPRRGFASIVAPLTLLQQSSVASVVNDVVSWLHWGGCDLWGAKMSLYWYPSDLVSTVRLHTKFGSMGCFVCLPTNQFTNQEWKESMYRSKKMHPYGSIMLWVGMRFPNFRKSWP